VRVQVPPSALNPNSLKEKGKSDEHEKNL